MQVCCLPLHSQLWWNIHNSYFGLVLLCVSGITLFSKWNVKHFTISVRKFIAIWMRGGYFLYHYKLQWTKSLVREKRKIDYMSFSCNFSFQWMNKLGLFLGDQWKNNMIILIFDIIVWLNCIMYSRNVHRFWEITSYL